MRTNNLGDVLVRMGKASQADISRAAEIQKGTKQLLGQVLIEMGTITSVDLEKALRYQERLQAGDAVGALVDIAREVQAVVIPRYLAARRAS